MNPDPLIFLYNYKNVADREIVGLIAATLAYGRVAQIIKDVEKVLSIMGKTPKNYLTNTPDNEIKESLRGFKHRFTTDEEMSALLLAIKQVIKNYGSLEALFIDKFKSSDQNILPALAHFIQMLKKYAKTQKSTLLSDPQMGSACKRLNLFLRWMVRSDAVDPGGWKNIPPSKLIIPLDTHMFYFGKCYGFTKRNSADLKTAIEITNGFKELCPTDPVKYDFALTRFGIRNDMCWENFNNIA
ncbi:MAG: TIGR02757 family protein [Pseudomonadota bacterium]